VDRNSVAVERRHSISTKITNTIDSFCIAFYSARNTNAKNLVFKIFLVE
jgi:hypothetical protein